MANISDGFVLLTDEVWDGSSLIISQLTGNTYNVDGNASGSTTNVAETTTGTFQDTNSDGELDGQSSSDPQEVYSAAAGDTLAATSDLLKYTIDVQSTVTLQDGTVITGVTLDVMVLENNQILFDFSDGDIAAHFNGASPIASIEVTGSTQNNYDWINIGAHDASYTPTCFAAGSLIQAEGGSIKIERIKVGDYVMTMDNGYQPVRWIGSSHFPSHALKKDEKLKPVVFAAGSLGRGLPKRTLRVSRQHRMLVSSKIAQRMFGSDSILIAAIKLVDMPGITIEETCENVDYLHLLLDRHEVVFANGVPSESLFLGQEAVRSLSTESRREISRIFPELVNTQQGMTTDYIIPEPKVQKIFIQRHNSNQTENRL